MHFIKNGFETAIKLLLYFGIVAYMLLPADKTDWETVMVSLGISTLIWGVIWFAYLLIHDAIIAIRWKEPTNPSSSIYFN